MRASVSHAASVCALYGVIDAPLVVDYDYGQFNL